MKFRTLAPLSAIALLALAGCSNSSEASDDTSQDSSSQSSSSAPQASSEDPTPAPMPTYEGITEWYGTAQGATFHINTTAQAPQEVQDAWAVLGTSYSVVSVEVDNTQGTAPVTADAFSAGSPAGDYAEFDRLNQTLNYQDAPTELDAGQSNEIIDVHNQYSEDAYTVAVGQKTELLLAGPTPFPEQVVAPVLNVDAMPAGMVVVPVGEEDSFEDQQFMSSGGGTY